MRVQLTMKGTSPLVMHNVQLADPTFSIAKAIAAITSKGSKQSDDDRLEVSRLSFHGGLYMGRGGPVMPSPNILRTIANAAKVRRLGKDVERSMIPTSLEFPLMYKGPREAAALWENEAFRYSAPVRIGKNVVTRMRPRFPEWQVVSEWELMTEILNLRDFVALVEVAGIIEGVGDARRIGYGRFTAVVAEMKTAVKPRATAEENAMVQ
jgi:hypothetical protein